MSFILDALKKSETDRQRGLGPSFSDVKSAARGRRIPILWIAIGLLLAINLVALGVLLLRKSAPPMSRTEVSHPAPQAPAAAAPVPTPVASTNPAAIASPLPAAAAPSVPATEDSAGESGAPEPLLDRPLGGYPSDRDLPTMNDVIVQGRARLPELHIDMHVYVQAPEQRFVSINGRKLREGMPIEEGLRVERITPDGVVLNQQGLRFFLPRP